MSEANDSVDQTDDNKGTSGTDGAGSGGVNTSDDTVKYDTYRKVLSEKKKRDEEVRQLREQLEERQAADKAAAEKDLEEQNKYKELLKIREDELAKAKSEAQGMKDSQQSAMKLDAFLTSLDSKLPKQYWGLVELDSIKLNPETSEVDDMSVTTAVEAFRKAYPEVLLKKSTAGLPSSAPSGTAAATRGEVEFSKLPASERNKILAADLINLRKA